MILFKLGGDNYTMTSIGSGKKDDFIKNNLPNQGDMYRSKIVALYEDPLYRFVIAEDEKGNCHQQSWIWYEQNKSELPPLQELK